MPTLPFNDQEVQEARRSKCRGRDCHFKKHQEAREVKNNTRTETDTSTSKTNNANKANKETKKKKSTALRGPALLLCTRDDYGKAGPFAVERLKMDLPFVNVCVCTAKCQPCTAPHRRESSLIVNRTDHNFAVQFTIYIRNLNIGQKLNG